MDVVVRKQMQNVGGGVYTTTHLCLVHVLILFAATVAVLLFPSRHIKVQ